MTQRPPARRKAILRALALVVPLAAASTAFSQQVSVCGTDFPHSTAALGRICMPGLVPWNGNLIVFAHGYVAPGEPIAIPESQLTLPDGASIPEIVNGLGFGFATTSYSKNGLAVLEGVADVTDLVQVFGKRVGQPRRVYLVGASEGGLVTTLAVEQPDVFSGGVATCGPVGDFRRQIDYWGDFRVLFDFYFPGVIPGDVLSVEDEVRENWKTRYVPAITRALTTRPALLDKLLRVSRAPFDPNDPESKIETALGILWYNVFATNDARAQLGGNPYDNSRRLYLGSGNDFWLNLLVERYHADWTALAEIDVHYQTNGRLEAPLVTLHTTADPIVPYWHEPLSSLKALANSGLLHANVPVFRYGHCSFKAEEALVALGLLVLKVEGRELLNAERVLPTKQARLRYRSLAKTHGLRR
jgi:pimeloyl-ACP methyl ester carboxylesterase